MVLRSYDNEEDAQHDLDGIWAREICLNDEMGLYNTRELAQSWLTELQKTEED